MLRSASMVGHRVGWAEPAKTLVAQPLLRGPDFGPTSADYVCHEFARLCPMFVKFGPNWLMFYRCWPNWVNLGPNLTPPHLDLRSMAKPNYVPSLAQHQPEPAQTRSISVRFWLTLAKLAMLTSMCRGWAESGRFHSNICHGICFGMRSPYLCASPVGRRPRHAAKFRRPAAAMARRGEQTRCLHTLPPTFDATSRVSVCVFLFRHFLGCAGPNASRRRTMSSSLAPWPCSSA